MIFHVRLHVCTHDYTNDGYMHTYERTRKEALVNGYMK